MAAARPLTRGPAGSRICQRTGSALPGPPLPGRPHPEPLEGQPLTLVQPLCTVEEARADRVNTPGPAENGTSTASFVYQSGLSGGLLSVVSTKTNAG